MKPKYGTLTARVANGHVQLTLSGAEPGPNADSGGRPARLRRQVFLPTARAIRKQRMTFCQALDPRGAPVLFEGRLDETFVDDDVHPNHTYVYWLEREGCPTLGPAVAKVRDAQVWWTKTEIDRRMRELAKRYPGLVRRHVVGRTAGGLELAGLLIGRSANPIALIGLIHAGESGPELLLPIVERLLREDADLLKTAGLAVLPVVNADERERMVEGWPWYLRTNARGVDLNRNFAGDWDTVDYMYGKDTSVSTSPTYRGQSPESEPETQAVVRFIGLCRPSMVFSYHHLASVTGGAFLGPAAAAGDAAYGTACKRVTAAYTRALYRGRRREPSLAFLTTPGSLPAWLWRAHGIPALDVEAESGRTFAPSRNDRTTPALLEQCRHAHARAIRAMLSGQGRGRP